MPSEEQNPLERKSSIENLESRLYSRTPPPLRHDEEGMGSERHIRIAPSWTEHEEKQASGWLSIITHVMPYIRRLFIASIIFFMFAAAIAFYGFWRGGNTVSPDNVSLAVSGPVSAPAGEEMTVDVAVGNLNELALDAVDLLVEYPAGTRNPEDLSSELPRYRESLGTLVPGAHISRQLSFVPFGEEGEKKKLHVSVEYRQKDSKAIFSRSFEYEFGLNAAPVAVTVDAPKEVNALEPFEVRFEIVSNASSVIQGLMLKAVYPFGFALSDGTPAPSFGKDTWQLGDLKPGEHRVVRLRGRLQATEETEHTFRFSIGTKSPKNERLLGTVFLSETAGVLLREPAVALELLLNGERGKTFVARGGENVRVDLLWTNNLPVKVTDLAFTVRLGGSIYDPASVEGGGGFYDSNTNTIRFDKRTVQSFDVVEPGKSDRLGFSFNLLSSGANLARLQNPSMTIEVLAAGKRLDEAGAFQEVSSSITREIKIASALSLISRLFYTTSAFTGVGPLPPKVGSETDYTVRWSLSNSSSAVSSASVRAVLPSYVKWLERVSPAAEKVTYNPVGGEVVWEVGTIDAGVGVGTPAREVSFQIGLLPSVSQVATSPILIGDAQAQGDDRFTGGSISSNIRPALTTSSLSDPGATPGSGVVVK